MVSIALIRLVGQLDLNVYGLRCCHYHAKQNNHQHHHPATTPAGAAAGAARALHAVPGTPSWYCWCQLAHPLQLLLFSCRAPFPWSVSLNCRSPQLPLPPTSTLIKMHHCTYRRPAENRANTKAIPHYSSEAAIAHLAYLLKLPGSSLGAALVPKVPTCCSS